MSKAVPDPYKPHRNMHISLVMNNSIGVRTLRSDLIRFLLSRGHQVTVLCTIDEAAPDLRRMGASVVNWSMTRSGLNPLREILSVVRLRRIIAHLQPDIILSFTPKSVLYGSIAARSTPNSSVFSVVAGLGFMFGAENLIMATIAPIIRLVFRLSLDNNLLVFFQNPDDQDLFIYKNILPRSRTCRVYGSGVDIRRFVPTSNRKPRSETVFIMVARLIKPKGVLDYIQAASILKSESCPARFMLLGPFDDHPTAIDQSTVRSSDDSGVIEYLGATTDVRPYLDEADVFVLPSYYREGTPRSTLEAMAMAKPIITTDSPGCRETVIDDCNGYLVPVRDAVKLAEAMRKLVGNSGRIREMGLQSRQMAENLYDVEKVNQHLWRQVLRACNERRNGEGAARN